MCVCGMEKQKKRRRKECPTSYSSPEPRNRASSPLHHSSSSARSAAFNPSPAKSLHTILFFPHRIYIL